MTPSPNLEALRAAYLTLLKLSLCDLVGTATGTVDRLAHGHVASRELRDGDRQVREEGRDWPAHALTMTGLHRLDDLQTCVESIVRDGIPGDLIEAGSWRGGSSMLMRATLNSLGDDRTVWVADSFQGFPAADRILSPFPETVEPYLTVYDFLAVALDEVQASFARLGLADGVQFVPGFFEATLPALAGRRWSIVRLDSDTYDSTLLALRSLYPGLAAGGYLIIDDYVSFDECREAVEHFRAERGIDEPIEPVDWTCARWRKRSEPDQPTDTPPPTIREVRSVQRAAAGRVPAHEELELAATLAALEATLAEDRRRAADEIAGLRAELAEITASTSWRITRPLRELVLQLRERQRSSRF